MAASERPLRMRQRTSSVIGSPLLLDLVLSESTIALQPRTAVLTRRHSFHHGQRPNLSTLERARAATMSALPLMRKSDEEISSDLRRVSEEKDEEVSTPAPSAAGALVVAGLFFLVVASGMATNVAFELLSREEPGCAGVLTLAQYLMALASSAPRAVAHLRRPSVPLRWHGAFTALMLLTAYCGNKSVDWKVPFPLYLIIKSSNLVANLLVGRFGFVKRYGVGQVAGVLLMTAGVVLATLVARRGGDDAEEVGGAQVAVGAALCALSTFTMAALGCLQERAFEVHGNNSEEAAQEVLFYIHFLGIVPLLALQGTAPLERAHRWVVAPGAALALPSALQSIAPPRLWALLALNLGACQCCKLGFFRLLAATTSLSATLAVISYRFLGICLSAFVFNAPPPPPNSFLVGVALTASGGLLYLSQSASPKSKAD